MMFRLLQSLRLAVGLAILGAWAVLSGCGYGTSDVSGIVRFDGMPLNSGRVTFFPENRPGRNVSGHIQPGGFFRIPHCPPGPARVTVQILPPRKGRPNPRQRVTPVPARYTDPETTELHVVVARRYQEVELDLHR
jgi:hypothetical protein